MRVRDHVLLSTAGAALVAPWVGRGAVGLWAGGILIDADHYLWFCLHQRRLNPLEAVRFFDAAAAPQHPATRALHSPVALFALLLLGARRRRFLPVALGMGLHVAVDVRHEARMHDARGAALERDDFSCQACGLRGADVGTHLQSQPRLLPSYRREHLISLCGPCHETAHARATGSASWV
ncbi:MAG: hypothetical protein M3P44_03345 [Actinomycetota bacterium]|nr:hypothetical protein [Actinomycetota bacterium]